MIIGSSRVRWKMKVGLEYLYNLKVRNRNLSLKTGYKSTKKATSVAVKCKPLLCREHDQPRLDKSSHPPYK